AGSVPVSAVSPIAVPNLANAIAASAIDTKGASPSTSDDSSSNAQPGAQNPGYGLVGAYPAGLPATGTSYSALLDKTGTNTLNPAQIIEQVAYAIQSTHVSGQEMQLPLDPPDLGSLLVNVSVHDGVLSARLETQNPATQQVLVDNLSQLKDSLTQQGVSFD